MTSHVEKPHTTPLTVALLQTDIVLTSAEENIDRVTHIMNQRPEADLYVLPEMWGTGFNPHPDKHEHEKAARALAWMKEEAAGRHCAMAGSLPVFDETDESWRNRSTSSHPTTYSIMINATFSHQVARQKTTRREPTEL